MTNEERGERRELIADLHAQSPAPKCGYWMTRNRIEGELVGKVDVWLSRPSRTAEDEHNVFWFVHGEDAAREHYGRWTIERAQREVGGGLPATDRECLVVGMVRL